MFTYRNRSIFVPLLLFVTFASAMETVVPLPDASTLKRRLKRAGMEHFEQNTSFSKAFSDQEQAYTLKHIIATITQAKSSYESSKLQYKCAVPVNLLIEAILTEDQKALRILQKEGLYKKTLWNIEWDKE